MSLVSRLMSHWRASNNEDTFSISVAVAISSAVINIFWIQFPRQKTSIKNFWKTVRTSSSRKLKRADTSTSNRHCAVVTKRYRTPCV